MWDHNPTRPGSRAGSFTSTFTAAGALHSHSTSISSFADLSASSTNIYSSHTRRVRSVRKLRQLLGPDEDEGNTLRMENLAHKELPLPPLPSPLIIPTDDEPTMSLPTPSTDIASEDEEEKALSLVYARRVKLEKLKRRFGEDVPKELIFFDQAGPSSPTLSSRGRSMSSPNVMTFAESEAQFRGHTKNASISTINPANVPTMALKRSKAMLRLWTSKSRAVSYNKLSEADIIEEDADVAADAEKGLNAEDEMLLTSLEGSTWGDYSKATEKGLEEIFSSDHDSMVPQFDVDTESSSENTSGVQIVRSRSTLVINRTSEDDEQPHFSTLVESSKKSVFFSMTKPPNVTEQALNSLTPRRSHDDTLGNNLSSPNMRVPRKARSAIALASESRIQATTPDVPPLSLSPSVGKQSWEHSAPSTPSTSSTPSPILRPSHHGKKASWNDDNLGIPSEDDRRTGRFTHRTSRPKGPRPSSRSRPRTADGTVAPKATSVEFRHSDEAVEHWQQLERQRKLVHNDSSPEGKISSSPKSYTLPTRWSVPPPPPPTKSPKHSKFNMSVSHEEPSSFSSITSVSAPQKTPSKTTATAIYFYHRGVVRLAVEDGTRGPKTVQTVYMRDVLNYLREMRYVH